MQGLVWRCSLSGDAGQSQQQQRGEGHGRHQHHGAKEPPGLQMVVDDAGEALKVVITEEAVPERLALHQQFHGIPRQAHQGRQSETGKWSQTTPGRGQITPQGAEQQQGESCEHHRHRPFRQNRQTQHQPGRPPAVTLGCCKPPPLQHQADGEQSAQQGITDGRATPDQHQRRETETQGSR